MKIALGTCRTAYIGSTSKGVRSRRGGGAQRLGRDGLSVYPRPETPLSLSEVVKKIVGDPDYATFIRTELQRARTAATVEEREEAMSNIDAHFTLSDEDLTCLNFDSPMCSGPLSPLCTATKTNMRLLRALCE